ncbi:MAG: DUF5615 family PIN-like protein [Mangrovibacterium sp.]|nr:DUF5615 family PIN-like protein [Mangrovibacterium sp.]
MIKLLFDQNLSPKLVISFDDSMHLQDLGLDSSDDLSVWEFAKKEGFTIVTKDSDFNNLVSYFGFPPKVIWLRRGNCSTKVISDLLNKNFQTIKAFIYDNDNGILSIS